MRATRLVGIGFMLSGVIALTFAVVGVSAAGATKATPANQPASCQHSTSANHGCQGNTTTTDEQCRCSSTTYGDTTTTGWDTTTTGAVTTTTPTTEAVTSTTGGVTSTSTLDTTPEGGFVATTTTVIHIKPKEVQSAPPAGPQIQTGPSGLLPVTGSPAAVPLAGLGLVLLGTGLGLTRRKRRLAD